MGACMSTKAVVAEEVNPVPHPQARRVWLVSTPVDSRDVPQDLIGIDADGLRAAMRNRGLETEHWALKVDPQADVKAEPSIFDITVQGGSLVSQVHSTSSPYWKGITRRVAIGWTLWTDEEIVQACKLLIQARPKYDGRTNNSQMLARLLGRHVDYVPAPAQQTETATTPTSTSPSGSILKTDSSTHDAALTPGNNRSQMTLDSGAQSQRSHSIESDANESKAGPESNVSRVPASIRNSQRMSVHRPPLIHLSTAPSAAASEAGVLVRPTLQRSAETDSGSSSPTTGSVRMSLPPQPRHLQQQQQTSSPLNPSHRMHRQTASELQPQGRARTHSDAAAAYATMSAADRRMTMDGTGRVPRASRRRSEAPAEWLVEMPSGGGADARFSSVRSRSGQGRDMRRDSVLSLGGGSGSVTASPSMGGWGAHSGFPAAPSMVGMPTMPSMQGMPMTGFGAPSQMGGGMGMFPPPSPSMMFNSGALQVPMPYFATPQMPFLPSMPMLAPPSPGFYSHASSGVPTPPESPHIATAHLPKSHVPEIMLSPPVSSQQRHHRQ
ncbi:hypothetical protein EX895_003346 [Sporisorium graminicola]|uniref:Uncharacterized protein n=1 Tax=Sporisorium graminicola TaxID=280036 RepID=A0A4U7KT49_9BASI|nr:hypothetical protein EX895_003346 [Sporisorium graminicola]TKY87765.1 hypothetical protein EX895_003346 [Sporisorium graminicola]